MNKKNKLSFSIPKGKKALRKEALEAIKLKSKNDSQLADMIAYFDNKFDELEEKIIKAIERRL